MDNNAAVNMLNIYLWAFVLKWCICYGIDAIATHSNAQPRLTISPYINWCTWRLPNKGNII